MSVRPEQRQGGRSWAKILGDHSHNSVELPARRGRNRTLLAKTCTTCGVLRLANEYGLTGHSRSPDPKCKGCHAEAVRGSEKWRKRYSSIQRLDRQRQASTIAGASRRGQQWTGPELEIALREDLTSVVAAKMLGRTKYAVETMRRRHRREPMIQRVAGIPRA